MKRVFKIPNDVKKEFTRLIGFYSSDDMDAMVTMVSLERGISRSKLLRIIVGEWFKKKKITLPAIIDSIAKKAYMKYEMDHMITGEEEASYKEFRRRLRQDLLSRSIIPTVVDSIEEKLNYVHQEKVENKQASEG